MIIIGIILPSFNSFDMLFCLALIAKAIASPNSFSPLKRFTDLKFNRFQGLGSPNRLEIICQKCTFFRKMGLSWQLWRISLFNKNVQTSISFVFSAGQGIATGRITCHLLLTRSSQMLSVDTFSSALEGSSSGHGCTLLPSSHPFGASTCHSWPSADYSVTAGAKPACQLKKPFNLIQRAVKCSQARSWFPVPVQFGCTNCWDNWGSNHLHSEEASGPCREPAGVLSLLCFLNTAWQPVSHSGVPVFIPSLLTFLQAVEDQTLRFSDFLVLFSFPPSLQFYL